MANQAFSNKDNAAKNRKAEFRGNLPILSANATAFFFVDPSLNTKVMLDKNAMTASINVSTDTQILASDGTLTPITSTTMSNSTILFNEIDAASTTDFFGEDSGLSIIKITGNSSASTIQFNITQDNNR